MPDFSNLTGPSWPFFWCRVRRTGLACAGILLSHGGRICAKVGEVIQVTLATRSSFGGDPVGTDVHSDRIGTSIAALPPPKSSHSRSVAAGASVLVVIDRQIDDPTIAVNGDEITRRDALRGVAHVDRRGDTVLSGHDA